MIYNKFNFIHKLFFIILISFLFSLGCSPEITEQINESSEPNIPDNVPIIVGKQKEISPEQPISENITNTTKNISTNIEISGSLDRQYDLNLCPHLKKSFYCDKYDVRHCDYKTIIGKNNYFPDYMNCRSGYKNQNENIDNKFCLIQDCHPITNSNIVQGYGGIMAFAEYEYFEEKTSSSINTHYTLKSCGEVNITHETQIDCTQYRSTLVNK